MTALHALSAWPERRPPRTERGRAQIAEQYAAHLPKARNGRVIGDDDLNAMKAAFIRRFDEQLPRTETLMAVANVGYRMALRDLASCDTHRNGEDPAQTGASFMGGAVGSEAGETPNG